MTYAVVYEKRPPIASITVNLMTNALLFPAMAGDRR